MKEEKDNIPVEAKPKNLLEINNKTGNIYESIVVLAKRANQLFKEEKEELSQKLADFAPRTDNLEEFFDNREQMEISAHYERLPKSTLVAIEELLDDKIYFRNPKYEDDVPEEEPDNKIKRLETD